MYLQGNTNFQNFIDSIPLLVWIKDENLTYKYANAKLCETTKLNPSDIIGKKDEDLWDEDIFKDFYKTDKIVLQTKKNIEFYETHYFYGKEMICKATKSPIFDTNGKLIGIMGTSQDITKFKVNEKIINKAASTDFLTQISNRIGYYEHLENKLQGEYKPLIVMYLNIDEFKQINDMYGYKLGDDILKIVSNKIVKFFKGYFVSRMGADEFVIVIERDMSEAEITKMLNKFLEKISCGMNIGSEKYFISASAGVIKTTPQDDIESIGIKADLAMYSAKQKGKNTFSFYKEGMAEDVQKKLKLEYDLTRAIQRDEIHVFYQPQYTSYGKLVGFEALFRWKNEKYKTIPVIKIIEIMEKSKLINKVGKYIFEKACIFAKEINENRKEPLVVSVNVSPVQIMRKDFVLEVKEIINNTKVDPNYIGIEVTEDILLENVDEGIDTLAKLKDMNIQIYLDDFGTRYSSLNYLVKLPISSLKIDKSFIDEICNEGRYNKLVKLIIDIAHSIGIPVVAEGVENTSQLNELKNMTIDTIQGYLFSKPIPQEEARKLIN